MNDSLLKSYWIQTRKDWPQQFGVSAYSIEDAFAILAEAGFQVQRHDAEIQEDIRFEDLDVNHVVPNMGPMVFRGVWFPRRNL